MRKVQPLSTSSSRGEVNAALLKLTNAKKEGELFALRPLKERNATQDITIRHMRATLLDLKTRLSKYAIITTMKLRSPDLRSSRYVLPTNLIGMKKLTSSCLQGSARVPPSTGHPSPAGSSRLPAATKVVPTAER